MRAGAHYVRSLQISFVDPYFVTQQKLARAFASETAAKNLIASIQSLSNAFADDLSARPEFRPEHPEASYLGVRSKAVNNPGDCGAVAVNVSGPSRTNLKAVLLRNDRYIIYKMQPG